MIQGENNVTLYSYWFIQKEWFTLISVLSYQSTFIWSIPRYKDGPSRDEFPMFESLKLTIDRTLPYWNDVIVPQVCWNFYRFDFLYHEDLKELMIYQIILTKSLLSLDQR